MMREADQDNKYVSKGSNLQTRSNLDTRGRRTEKKILHRTDLETAISTAFCLGNYTAYN